MKYILSSAVVTNEGLWDYEEINTPTAAAWLRENDWKSTVGYGDTAAAASVLFGLDVPFNRETIQMQPGDEALVFRLVFPAGSPGIPTRQKGQFTKEFVQQYCQCGILRRLGGPQEKETLIADWQALREFLNRSYVEESTGMQRNALDDNNLEKGWLSELNQKRLHSFFQALAARVKKYAP